MGLVVEVLVVEVLVDADVDGFVVDVVGFWLYSYRLYLDVL